MHFYLKQVFTEEVDFWYLFGLTLVYYKHETLLICRREL